MTDYTKTPLFISDTFRRVPEAVFGEAVRNVVRLLGPLDDEKAMQVADAVLAPLLLLSPPPAHDLPCDHAYVLPEGGWRFCGRYHDRDPNDDPEFHATADGETDWFSDGSEFRAFDPWGGS